MTRDGWLRRATESGSAPRRGPAGRTRPLLVQAWYIFLKDVRIEVRRKETPTAMVVYALFVLVVFNFAIDVQLSNPAVVAPGIFWTAILFAGMLGFSRVVTREQEQRTIDGLLLAPIDRAAIYLAKLGLSFCTMAVLEVVVIPGFGLLYNQSVLQPRLWLGVLVGTLAFAIIGTLFAGITAHARAREALLPVLLLPTAVPVIIGATAMMSAALTGASSGVPWLGLLVVFCVVYLAAAVMLAPSVLEEL